MDEKSMKAYVVEDEEKEFGRQVRCTHKKVMFLCAIARPRWNTSENRIFNGKIGIWPFIEMRQAKNNSRNRPAGTWEMVPKNVTRDVYREMMIDKVIPAIVEKWPADSRNIAISIQQDNAKPHIHVDDEEINFAMANTGMNMHMLCQPANSPDLNVLDLGIFSKHPMFATRVGTEDN